MEQLISLLSKRTEKLKPWMRGNIPDYKHYKRITTSKKKTLELAKLGAAKILAYFGVDLYFSQAVVAGAVLSGDYDKIIICTPSQYGKSMLMGMLAMLRAYEGGREYIAASTGDGTDIIMYHCIQALQNAAPEIQNALVMQKSQLEKLATSVSKTNIAFSDRGTVEPLTLGDTYQDNIGRNKAIGRGGDFIVDEAGLISDKTFAEMGRSEFASTDGTNGIMVKISNPHKPGTFYDELTDDYPDRRTFILWMDALTAVEEGRWTAEKVLNSTFAKHRSTRRRYLLCVLDEDGDSMFPEPKSYRTDTQDYKQYFIGVDASYKGKDKTSIAVFSSDEYGIGRIEGIKDIDIKGKQWIQGKTSDDIANEVARVAYAFHAGMICVDSGSGIWLVEALEKRGLNVRGINFNEAPTKARVRNRHYAATNAANVRAEMHLDMQGLMESDRLLFQEDTLPYIKPVLPFITSERKSNGKIQIEQKSRIKAAIGHSPDELDACLLAIHAGVLFSGIGYMT